MVALQHLLINSVLNFWLARFVAEVRRSDGKPYPPKSIHQLICGVLRHMCSVDPACPNVLDRKDPRFRDFHGACEVIFHRLHQRGIGTDVNPLGACADYTHMRNNAEAVTRKSRACTRRIYPAPQPLGALPASVSLYRGFFMARTGPTSWF